MDHRLRTIVLSLFMLAWVGVNPGLAQTAGEYRQRGLSYRNQGQLPEAIEALEQAVALEPANLSGRVLLGWTLHLAGNENRAATILDENRHRDPFHLETLNALGIVYLVQGKLWAAAGTHTWAGLLKPDNEIAFYNLSLAFQGLALYDWSIATAEYASVLEPQNPHPLVALALAYDSRSSGLGNASLSTPNAVSPAVDQAPQAPLQTVLKTILDQTIALDDRYQDLVFLEHLQEAGFSEAQIQQVKDIFAWYLGEQTGISW
jgi:tetratricopeptide (TPR) repeat protein